MNTRRLFIKLFDIITVSFIIALVSSAIMALLSATTGVDLIQELSDLKFQIYESASNGNVDVTLIQNNIVVITFFTLLKFVVTLVLLYIYFGVFGKKFEGSFGKSFFNLKMRNVDDKILTTSNYFLREPYVHVFIICSVLSSIALLIPQLFGIIITIAPIYLILFFLDRDFWNKRKNYIFENIKEKEEIGER